MKKFQKIIVLAGVLLSLGLFTGTSQAILFDFDDPALSQNDLGPAIATYMTAVYGSTVQVYGAYVTDLDDLLGTDKHIANSENNFGTNGMDIIVIKFPDVPISAMSFDWEVMWNPSVVEDNIDFRWIAYDQSYTAVTGGSYNLPWNSYGGASGSSGPLDFTVPIYQIVFTDNMVHQIGVDNLDVTPVPEPATLFLLGVGFLSFFIGTRVITRFKRAA